eukprot:TRINITY_DN5471_c0_g1_i1.p1 TRINITY_DN5471_c0_g1~~TRINITY_DN5471_c0_g1_i1.p1  ORF type:complete len:532 (-),score=97.03 TRINITY_DN5471_c0_g1_i1:227-1822(-)
MTPLPLCVVVAAVCVLSLATNTLAGFKNPIFTSQDPWVTKVDGVYYYTESYCGKADICVKISPTLTGLSTADWVGVWSASAGNANSDEIWAPEMHYIDGAWYIYYAADSGNNNNHRLFVLKGSSPKGPFSEGATGLPHGQMKEQSGHWAIDPDVFKAADGKLYITFSCTDYVNSNFPQRICLAPLSDPVTISGPTVYLSTPTEYWEMRTAPIQEGPVGYTYNGSTYITYSGSASWISNAYSVGILSLKANSDPLVAANWAKSGPILDRHSNVFGPGSVVFVPSPDDSEYWVMYHAIDKANCQPSAYACRDIRLQQMFFDPSGYPILGYPVNPGVDLPLPAGESGAPKGHTLVANFGDAWGDHAEGNNNGGLVAGKWNYTDRFGATSNLGGTWDQIFSPWNPNPQDFTAHVEVQLVRTGTTTGYEKYGFYCAYDDENNHVELFLDVKYKVLASHAVVGGKDQGWQNSNLPANFDASQWHSLDCIKSQATFTFVLDNGAVRATRSLGIISGQTGLVVEDTIANYRNLQLIVHY